MREVELLKVGRHFRLDSGCKVVIGRNQKENEAIERLAARDDAQARVVDFPGPLVLTVGRPDLEDWEKVARLAAAYGDGPAGQMITILVNQGKVERTFRVPKLPKETFKNWML